MSIKQISHKQHHIDFKELETFLEQAFDAIMLLMLLTFSFWFIFRVQIDPSANSGDLSSNYSVWQVAT